MTEQHLINEKRLLWVKVYFNKLVKKNKIASQNTLDLDLDSDK